MKRDMDLIRLVILDVEGEDDVDLGQYSPEQVSYHRWLVLDAGLANGSDVTGMGNSNRHAILTGLTWTGHDFIDAARDETIWRKAQKTIAEKAGTAAFKVLMDLLIVLAKDQLMP